MMRNGSALERGKGEDRPVQYGSGSVSHSQSGVRFNRIKIDRGDDGGAFLGAFPV